MREIVHKAFWDKLSAELKEDPPNYTQALVLIGDVKEVCFCSLLVKLNVCCGDLGNEKKLNIFYSTICGTLI